MFNFGGTAMLMNLTTTAVVVIVATRYSIDQQRYFLVDPSKVTALTYFQLT